jgi:choice-of-anchor C domain-containing protein
MKLISLAIASAAAALSVNAGAVTLINGGFETGAPTGEFTTAPPVIVPGWDVTAGTVDHIGTYWTNNGGSAGSIDLAGSSPGTLAQTFATVAGQAYRVTFFIAGNNGGGSAIKSLNVLATGGSTANYAFDTTGFGRTNMGWSERFYNFRASGSSSTLSFAAGSDSSFFGPALDDVSIAAVPEPTTWAMMILGFAVVGGAMRRRKTAVRVTYA